MYNLYLASRTLRFAFAPSNDLDRQMRRLSTTQGQGVCPLLTLSKFAELVETSEAQVRCMLEGRKSLHILIRQAIRVCRRRLQIVLQLWKSQGRASVYPVMHYEHVKSGVRLD